MITKRLHIFVILIVSVFGWWSRAAAQVPVEASAPTGRVFVVRAKVTAYCTCARCCQRYAGGKRTASGTDARKPTGVAASQRLLPFGSRVYLPDLAVNPVRVVDDTGGGMRRSAREGVIHVDVRFPSHGAALRFGSREENLYVWLSDASPDQLAFFSENALFAWYTQASDPAAALFETRTLFVSASTFRRDS